MRCFLRAQFLSTELLARDYLSRLRGSQFAVRHVQQCPGSKLVVRHYLRQLLSSSCVLRAVPRQRVRGSGLPEAAPQQPVRCALRAAVTQHELLVRDYPRQLLSGQFVVLLVPQLLAASSWCDTT